MNEPKRWLDPDSQSSPSMRELLHAARLDLPTEERVEKIGFGLGPGLGGPPPAGPADAGASGAAGGAAAAGAKIAVAVKFGAIGVIALGTALGTTYVQTRNVQSDPGRVPIADMRAVPPTTMPAHGLLDVAKSCASASASCEPAPEAQSALASEPALAPAPSQGTRSAPLRADETEVTLLEAAVDDLRSNPAMSLEFTDRHTARYPRGALVQEREVIAIEALLALHRDDDARRRAARFDRVFANSAHRARVDALVAEDASFHNP